MTDMGTLDTGFRERLIAGGILFPTGVDGVWGRSGVFERIHDGLDRAITRAGIYQHAEVMRFPPAMAQQVFEKSGYMKNFPQLAGTVHCFCGDDRAHRALLGQLERGEDWLAGQQPAGLVLTPAACHPVYPIVAARGALGENGHLVDVASFCFRHEPSLEPTRLQMFRMREYVRIGTAEQVIAFREAWMERGQAFIRSLALPFDLDVANDPFFGRAGKLMKESQRAQALKFELLIPVNDGLEPTACLSFNYHMTHFADAWDIRTDDGSPAQTACVGFGMERLVLALLRHHGFEIAGWPAGVRDALDLG
jgi:seryl-tRNA synthetase